MTITTTKERTYVAIDIETHVPTDTYANVALVDVRSIDQLGVWLKNTGSNTIKFKIQTAKKNAEASTLVDADFSDYVAETTLAGGVAVADTYMIFPKGRFTAVRVQVANNTGGQANEIQGYVRSYA